MAILNGLYIHVVEESLAADVEATSHPVESGVPTSDTVRPKAITIALSGKIVDYGDMTAQKVITKINELKDSGSLIEYRGRNIASSMQIQAFETKHLNTNNGGADFNMELRHVRIAKSAYVPKPPSEVKDPVIEVGSTVIFKGGSVYVSSDAPRPASTRSRSTCKVTIISTASYSIHPYHLISTDGKGVYGWVDKENIEGVVSGPITDPPSPGGTQQPTPGRGDTKVYHFTKQGDTVYNLVNTTYKDLNTTIAFVIGNNSHAFTELGDPSTMKIGVRILMGYKQTGGGRGSGGGGSGGGGAGGPVTEKPFEP